MSGVFIGSGSKLSLVLVLGPEFLMTFDFIEAAVKRQVYTDDVLQIPFAILFAIKFTTNINWHRRNK